MKAVTQKVHKEQPNAWGQYHLITRQHFVIEACDVGKQLPHYGGYDNKSVFITKDDVNKTFVRMTDEVSAWACWQWDELKRCTVCVNMESGDYFVTSINCSYREAIRYYLGRYHVKEDFETGKETHDKYVSVELVSEADAELERVHSDDRYDYYATPKYARRERVFNVVPKGSAIPTGGYCSREYIERVKGVKFPDKVQP